MADTRVFQYDGLPVGCLPVYAFRRQLLSERIDVSEWQEDIDWRAARHTARKIST